MHARCLRRTWLDRLRATAAAGACGIVVSAHGQVVFFDGFETPATRLDPSSWTTEIGPPSFLGRTQLADWVTPGGLGHFDVDGGTAKLALSTHNPTGPSLYGTHAKSLLSFKPTAGTGYELTVRLRLTSIDQPGIVYGIYFFGCEAGSCATLHDELDIEILTNMLQLPTPLVQHNRYAAEPLGAGHGGLAPLPAGFDPLASHDWAIRWQADRVTYLVDGHEIHGATTFVPRGAMQVNLIAWGPGPEWPDAFSASLQPTGAPGTTYSALVEQVTVTAVPVPEPAAYLQMGYGLAVLAWLGGRCRAARRGPVER